MSISRIGDRSLTRVLVILWRSDLPLRFTRRIILLIRVWFGASMEGQKASMLVGSAAGAAFSAWASALRVLFMIKISRAENGSRQAIHFLQPSSRLSRPRPIKFVACVLII